VLGGPPEPQPQEGSRLFPPVKTDGIETETSKEQKRLERMCGELLESFTGPEEAELKIDAHTRYLIRGLTHLPAGYSSLDASRPWILYWILHSMELIGMFEQPLSEEDAESIISFVKRCQAPTGGFGGGPNQRAHLAPTYAAVMSLVILGSKKGFEIIDRQKMYEFLMSVKVKSGFLRGGFAVTLGGEVDTRGTYTCLAVASILNILTPELAEGAAEFVARNQTYEGGIGAEPGNEAHGGYAYCGLAALQILKRTDAIDLESLLRWTTQRQMSLEGGFQGRTNKLVDSCYSWWVGGIFPLLQPLLSSNSKDHNTKTTQSSSEVKGVQEAIFDAKKLQEYILICCQMNLGGLRDKPGKRQDYYHTCYSLSGLSMAQHQMETDGKGGLRPLGPVGGSRNQLYPTDPTYNVSPKKVALALEFFGKLSKPKIKSSSSDSNISEEKEGGKKHSAVMELCSP